MKAKLIFDLDEENNAFHMAVKGSDAFMALWAFDSWLRGRVKYGQAQAEVMEAEKVREELWDVMAQYSIDLELLN